MMKNKGKTNLVSLWDDRNQSIQAYSKGMLQRLGLGVILFYDFIILF
ncbi:hypothetical protein [Oceanobacillus halotolerans]|nr:hypothetical protein [Oceanobacillus halotolerans]